MAIPKLSQFDEPPRTGGDRVFKVTGLHVVVDGELITLDVSDREPPILISERELLALRHDAIKPT